MCRWTFPAQSFSGPSPLGLEPVFYFLRFETSLFDAFYDSQGHGGGIRLRLHTELTGRADCLQDKSSARKPQKTPPSFLKDECLQLSCLVTDVLLFRAFAWRGPHIKHSFPYIVVTFLRGRVYRSLHRNGSTSIVACICCRENVCVHSSIVA
jgi:hypothetical protein